MNSGIPEQIKQALLHALPIGLDRVSQSDHDRILTALAPHFTQQGDAAKDDAYWRGYHARIDELMTELPEPKNPTLWRYLNSAHEKNITFHTIGVNRIPDGGFHFYIHPQSVSGETEDYLIWPDPFNWSDMIVNKKDSPAPNFEKFRKYLSARLNTEIKTK